MSHKATHWAWSVTGISSSEKLILLALADRHNADTGDCFPSLERIAEDTCTSRDTARRATQSLEQKGLLSRSLVSDLQGRTLGYRYHLHMGDSMVLPGGLHGATPEGGTVLPKPVKETCKEEPTLALRSNRGTRLPNDWSPTDEQLSFARGLGVDGYDQAERFRDYWIAQPGQKGVKLDWNGTWRNWIRRAAERRLVRVQQETPSEIGRRLLREIEHEQSSSSASDHNNLLRLWSGEA